MAVFPLTSRNVSFGAHTAGAPSLDRWTPSMFLFLLICGFCTPCVPTYGVNEWRCMKGHVRAKQRQLKASVATCLAMIYAEGWFGLRSNSAELLQFYFRVDFDGNGEEFFRGIRFFVKVVQRIEFNSSRWIGDEGICNGIIFLASLHEVEIQVSSCFDIWITLYRGKSIWIYTKSFERLFMKNNGWFNCKVREEFFLLLLQF